MRWTGKRSLPLLLVVLLTLGGTMQSAFSHGTAWVFESEGGPDSTSAETQEPSDCEGVVGIPFGADPAWVRVGGSWEPSTPFVEAQGQILPTSVAGKTNAFITHTDNPGNHYSLDVNVFLTPDVPYRTLLGTGNFVGGSENEHGHLEIEWERGAIPVYAFPAIGDRMTVWGAHVWDCGHGDALIDEDDEYRSEIHPPVGWVLYRNTADADGVPQGDKRTQNPWRWYESTDLQGSATVFPDSGMQNTPIQATIADAYFSSFGGNVPESLNGCDVDDIPDPCRQQNEWRQSLLQQDYSFFVPAPPRPSPDTVLIWKAEDRCSSVPSNPGNPPGDDIDDVGEAGDTAENIGDPTCNIPDEVTEVVENGQPGIRVTVKANSSGVSYPSNNYIAFAKRYAVGWDFAPSEALRARTLQVNFQTLRVYDDAEPCGEDGEWVMSLRANEAWIYPVRGSGDDGDPFYEDGAIDDDKCIIGQDPGFRSYGINENLTINVGPGQPVTVWSRTFDVDPLSNDPLPVIESFHGDTGTFTSGNTNTDTEGAHTIVYNISDATPPAPTLGTLAIGDLKYGPNGDTGGTATRIAAATPVELQGSNAASLQFRFWPEGGTPTTTWSFDTTSPLRVDLAGSGAADGTYIVEYAPVSDAGIVGERRRVTLQLDTTPPALTVPDNITVDATEAAGTVVNYTATATDNLPGPTTFICNPPSGNFFPIETVTIVNCTATDAVGNQTGKSFTVEVVSPFGYIPDFVLLAHEWVRVGNSVIVQSGNVGAFDTSVGVPGTGGFEVFVDQGAQLLNGSQVAAESVQLGTGVVAGETFYVDRLEAGTGAVYTPKIGYVPLFLGMPVVPAFSAGGPNLDRVGVSDLAAGSYGSLKVKSNAVVTLTGGNYYFSSVEVFSDAQLRASAPSVIHVAGRVEIRSKAAFGPKAGSAVSASEIVVYVLGQDVVNGSKTAVMIGSKTNVSASIYARNGTLSIGPNAVASGAFLGLRVLVDQDATVSLDSGFDYP